MTVLTTANRIPQIGDKIHDAGSKTFRCYGTIAEVIQVAGSYIVRWYRSGVIAEMDANFLRYVPVWGMWIGAVGMNRSPRRGTNASTR